MGSYQKEVGERAMVRGLTFHYRIQNTSGALDRSYTGRWYNAKVELPGA
jgi:hypothetical protein